MIVVSICFASPDIKVEIVVLERDGIESKKKTRTTKQEHHGHVYQPRVLTVLLLCPLRVVQGFRLACRKRQHFRANEWKLESSCCSRIPGNHAVKRRPPPRFVFLDLDGSISIAMFAQHLTHESRTIPVQACIKTNRGVYVR